MSTSCRLCGGPCKEVFVLNHAVVYRCLDSSCDLRFADPQLGDKELERAYGAYYYPSEGSERQIFEATPERVLKQMFQSLDSERGPLRGLRLLDFGFGNGEL